MTEWFYLVGVLFMWVGWIIRFEVSTLIYDDSLPMRWEER